MKRRMRQTSVLLLAMLMWSCFGLGIGMIGHSIIDTHAFHVDSSKDEGAHACCSVPASDDVQDTGVGVTDHHPMNAIIGDVARMVSTAVPFVFSLCLSIASSLLVAWLYQYAVYWEREVSYVALHLQRLFRTGVLHPKIW